MKRIFAIILCACLFLTACGQAPVETTPPTTTETAAPTTQETTVETTMETTVETTAETTVPLTYAYQHPLTGVPLKEEWVGHATAVVLNNIVQCLPQHGISNADIIYELETEGGITRLLGIYSDLENVGNIGPVRSARSFFNSIALSYKAPIIHCGGSVEGRNGHYSDNGDTIDNWAHIDETYNGRYFFRDQNRLNSGFSYEHTLFTTGNQLLKALADKNLNTPTSLDTDFGLSFNDSASISGKAANTVKITFNGSKTTTMEYNAETSSYDFYQYKSLQVDGNNKKTVSFTNVLVLNTKQWYSFDGTYNRSFYTLVGSGTGYYAMGGQIIPIKWSRPVLRGPITFTLADGTPLELAVGTTYIGISGNANYISYN